jgi:acyl-coenzyme A synthetase/AMP-(fatty) acid ligase
MDLSTSLGYQFFIYTLWRGGTLFFAGGPLEAITRAFDVYDVENMVASPSGLAAHLRFYEEHPELNCGLRMILTAGSLLSPSLAERVRARMCDHLISLYGATEVGMVATAPAQVLAQVPGAVGQVMPDTTVQIVNANNEALPAGSEGIVRVRGSCAVSGYVGDPPEAQSAFVNGWFFPGDVGRLTVDGLLVISGRSTSVMNLGGDKVKPETIEEALASHPMVHEAAAFNVTADFGIDEVWALVVGRGAWSASALRAHCEGKLPAHFVPRRFIEVKSLPRNANGKLERRDLASLARAESGSPS